MDLVAELGLGRFIFTQWLTNTARYFFAAGLGWLVIHHLFKGCLAARRHAPRPASRKDIKREILHSLQSGIVFLLPTLWLVTWGKDLGLSKIYWSLSDHSIGWYIASFFVMFFWHDTWFYWTHRLMHHPALYKRFHHVHHQSVYPTPWAAFSFNASEAVVESLVFVIAVMLLPFHWSIPPLFNLYSILANVHGHLGHDIFQRETLEKLPFRWFNHPSSHGQHHLRHRGNYSLYLVFWDKLMDTWIGHLPASTRATGHHESAHYDEQETHQELQPSARRLPAPQ